MAPNLKHIPVSIIDAQHLIFSKMCLLISYVFVAGTSAYDCNFEKDFCGWSLDKTADFNFTRTQGPTGSSSTGPTRDHTLNTGMRIDA